LDPSDASEALRFVVDWFERIRLVAEPLIDAAYPEPVRGQP
jgi:hypothetical protein